MAAFQTSTEDLAAQFRCGGCQEYLAWVDWLLGFSAEKPERWGNHYRVELVDTPEAIEQVVHKARLAGESARMVASAPSST